MRREKFKVEEMLAEKWRQIQADEMCSDVWRGLADKERSYGIAFVSGREGDEGHPLEKAATRQIWDGYVRLKGSFWAEEKDTPLYEAEAFVQYGISKEELTSTAWKAGQEFFLFSERTKGLFPNTQALAEQKVEIAKFFAALAKSHGVDLEKQRLFRLQEKVIRHPLFQYMAGGPYWVTIYESRAGKDLLKPGKYDPEPFLQKYREAIEKDASVSALWRAVLENEESIGVISAQEAGTASFLKHLELKQMIRVRKNPFVEFVGGFQAEENSAACEAEAVMIFGITKRTLLRLARRLRQKVVLYSDKNGSGPEFKLLSVLDSHQDPGYHTLAAHKPGAETAGLALTKEALQGFFQALFNEEGVLVTKPTVFRLREEIALPRLHRYRVSQPLLVINHERRINFAEKGAAGGQ